MTFSTKIPREYGPKITVPLAERRCNIDGCGHVGVPVPVMTCLGDHALRLGGWCQKCRRLTCLLDMTLESLSKAGMDFLVYDQKLPQPGCAWPKTPKHFFDPGDFPFGANVKEERTQC